MEEGCYVERQFLRFTTRARFRLERLPLAGNVFPRVHFVPLMFAPFHPPKPRLRPRAPPSPHAEFLNEVLVRRLYSVKLYLKLYCKSGRAK